jgi:hypothetical protein
MNTVKSNFDRSIVVGDIYRVIGTGDFFTRNGMGQLVQVEKIYKSADTYYVQFKYFDAKGDTITCVAPTVFHNLTASSHELDEDHVKVSSEPKIKTILSGRKIWYQFDARHVTPRPRGPFPMIPNKTYAGSDLIGKWVHLLGGNAVYESFGLALPFHLKAPSGSGTEEHGPPVITLNKIKALYNYRVNGDIKSGYVCANLWGLPREYTYLEEMNEADIALIMQLYGLDPNAVIPFLMSEYEKVKKNTKLNI